MTAEPGKRYRLSVCRACDRGFAEIVKKGPPRRYCDNCSRGWHINQLRRAQKRDAEAQP